MVLASMSHGATDSRQRAIDVALLVLYENLCENIHHEYSAVSQVQLSHLSATLKVIANNYDRFWDHIRNYLLYRRHPTYMGDVRSFRRVRKTLAQEGLTAELLFANEVE
jgi:hypothetical protein